MHFFSNIMLITKYITYIITLTILLLWTKGHIWINCSITNCNCFFIIKRMWMYGFQSATIGVISFTVKLITPIVKLSPQCNLLLMFPCCYRKCLCICEFGDDPHTEEVTNILVSLLNQGGLGGCACNLSSWPTRFHFCC